MSSEQAVPIKSSQLEHRCSVSSVLFSKQGKNAQQNILKCNLKITEYILQSLVKSYPVKQQAILKSRACLLSTFLTLVLQVWWQFGQVTVVGHLLKYIPSVVAPCKYPSDNYN